MGYRPYYYGKYKWDDYLRDIREGIDQTNELQEQSHRLQEDALAESQAQTEELRLQTARLGEIGAELGELRAEISWGFNLVVDRLDQQLVLFSKAVETLDEIHKTLRSPLMTQAKELLIWGDELFRKGLYDKALEAFRQSEQKNEVNYLLQFRIGTLLLEGKNAEADVIDVAAAEKHLLLAARYARAEAGSDPHWKRYCAEAYQRAGNAAYLIGEQQQKAGDTAAMHACLRRSLEHFGKAVQLCSEMTGVLYSQAKCHALLGEKQKVLDIVQEIADRDRRYSAALAVDRDFDTMRAETEDVFKFAIDHPGPLARMAAAKLDKASEVIEWAKKRHLDQGENGQTIAGIDDEVKNTRRLLRTLSIDIEDLNKNLVSTIQRLEKVGEVPLLAQVAQIQSQIDAIEKSKGVCRQEIWACEKQISEVKAGGIGCLTGGIAFFVGAAIFKATFSALGPILLKSVNTQSHSFGIPVSLSMLAFAIAGGYLGAAIGRAIKRTPPKMKIAGKEREICALEQSLVRLKKQLSEAESEVAQFRTWASPGKLIA